MFLSFSETHTLTIQIQTWLFLPTFTRLLNSLWGLRKLFAGKVGFVLHSSKWCMGIRFQSYYMDDNYGGESGLNSHQARSVSFSVVTVLTPYLGSHAWDCRRRHVILLHKTLWKILTPIQPHRFQTGGPAQSNKEKLCGQIQAKGHLCSCCAQMQNHFNWYHISTESLNWTLDWSYVLSGCLEKARCYHPRCTVFIADHWKQHCCMKVFS